MGDGAPAFLVRKKDCLVLKGNSHSKDWRTLSSKPLNPAHVKCSELNNLADALHSNSAACCVFPSLCFVTAITLRSPSPSPWHPKTHAVNERHRRDAPRMTPKALRTWQSACFHGPRPSRICWTKSIWTRGGGFWRVPGGSGGRGRVWWGGGDGDGGETKRPILERAL